MDKAHFPYSLKNIPVPNKNSYLKLLIAKTESFFQRLRWAVFFFKKEDHDNTKTKKNTYGFKTEKTAPQDIDLIDFENDLISVISNIKFTTHLNQFQQQLKKDAKKINTSNKLFVVADKTTNVYEVDKKTYNKLLKDNVTTHYMKTTTDIKDEINNQAANIATELDIAHRVEILAEKPCYVTLKDHKDNFENNPKCRLINPAKSNIGRIGKDILQKANNKIRTETKLSQWRNTQNMLDWFNNLSTEHPLCFLQLDIEDFYASISERLFNNALEYANQFYRFSDVELKALKNARQSLLFHNNDTWQKQTNLFDCTMGAYDGAEVAELIGLFMLNKINTHFPILTFGIYRDDGLAVHRDSLPGPERDRLRKQLIQLFKDNELKITIETNLQVVNFLDVTLNISNRTYRPYSKPNNIHQYINTKSNHPPAVLTQLPDTINRRLNAISCNEEVFKTATPEYEEALKKSGYKTKLTYTPKTNETHEKNNRKRKIIYYNPPYNMSAETSLGHQFLRLLDKHFPPTHALHKLINRKTVKLSYSCTSNIKHTMQAHNTKLLNTKEENTHEKRTCNCRKKEKCPLNGHCLEETIVYQAEVKNGETTNIYTGSTEGPFKTPWPQYES